MLVPLVPLVAALLAAAPQEVGAITGAVVSHDGAPVVGAEVLLLDGSTGYPVSSTTKASVFRPDADGKRKVLDEWWAATTDREGRFGFDGVAPGTYRLVAQSWRDGEIFEDRNEPRAKASILKPATAVDLRGVADGVEVEADETAKVEIRPLGDCVFVYDRGASNDDWYLMLSIAPPSADPILGFVGWRGAFAANAVGAIRMREGQAIVRGLPATHVHYAIFASDSNPCWGAGSFRGNLKRINAHATNLVGGWSDARKTPPETLAPLVDLVRHAQEQLGQMAVMGRVLAGREAEWQAYMEKRGSMVESMFAAADILGPLDRKVALEDDGAEYRVGDLLAAVAYVRLGAKR